MDQLVPILKLEGRDEVDQILLKKILKAGPTGKSVKSVEHRVQEIPHKRLRNLARRTSAGFEISVAQTTYAFCL